jgi:hypothetical protein
MSPVVLREEHELQVPENKILRKIFGPKKAEISAHFRILDTRRAHLKLLGS